MAEPTQDQVDAFVNAASDWYHNRDNPNLEALFDLLEDIEAIPGTFTPPPPATDVQALELWQSIRHWAVHRTSFSLRRIVRAFDSILNP